MLLGHFLSGQRCVLFFYWFIWTFKWNNWNQRSTSAFEIIGGRYLCMRVCFFSDKARNTAVVHCKKLWSQNIYIYFFFQRTQLHWSLRDDRSHCHHLMFNRYNQLFIFFLFSKLSPLFFSSRCLTQTAAWSLKLNSNPVCQSLRTAPPTSSAPTGSAWVGASHVKEAQPLFWSNECYVCTMPS